MFSDTLSASALFDPRVYYSVTHVSEASAKEAIHTNNQTRAFVSDTIVRMDISFIDITVVVTVVSIRPTQTPLYAHKIHTIRTRKLNF